MGYFDDLCFLGAAAVPACQAFLDRRFPDYWSLELCSAGRMEMAIDGGPRTVLDRPVAFWHLPRHRYRYGAADRRGWDQHWVLMQGPRAERLIEELARVHPAGFAPIAESRPYTVRMRELIALVRTGDPAHHAEAVALVEDLVARLVTRPPVTGVAGAVQQLADRLRADPVRRWDIAAETRRLGVSAVHLRRSFRVRFGCGPLAYLLGCRMRLASRALIDGSSVGEAASLAGYADPLQFSRMFRRHTGMSPRAYRAAIPENLRAST